jgi:hypothetical protein
MTHSIAWAEGTFILTDESMFNNPYGKQYGILVNAIIYMHFDSINSHHEIHPSYSLTFMK